MDPARFIKTAVNAAQVTALNAQVNALKGQLEQTRRQLQAERDAVIPNEAQLHRDLDTAQADLNRVKAEMDKAKTLINRRKAEIDDWKQWYYRLSGLNKTIELGKLNAEIAWRAAEITTLQAQIAALAATTVQAMNVVETLKHRLAAVETGVYHLPLEQDPRLLSLRAEYDQAVAALNRLTS